ncbi:MAG: 3-hydroxyacyl-CoA dehydrogenase/enoyl-CoA hydratase family protein [Chloroflexi bacterium]|nr:3-hydroxyacyl-CoA dehydrogenase/enoyl-CoA hydratase family protein [Chloroflexota bacterium]
MNYKVDKAVVIGAGTMGAAIAAHLANAGVRVTLLDIVPDELSPKEEKMGLKLDDSLVRNRIVREGLERAIKARPANFVSAEHNALVTLGNLEDDFGVLEDADWVIEAVVENLEIKQKLMARIDKARAANTIVTTNTSGIPVHSIAEGLSEDFRKHFLGTHFFNPPRYMKLLEIIPTADTSSDVIEFISHFGEFRLGKGIVMCNDTPNFIANRFLSVAGAYTMDYILEHGYTVPEVDVITGPVIGRPKTASFRLRDLVGIDVSKHVSNNLAKAIPEDKIAQKALNSERNNKLTDALVEKGWLGRKSGQGFYKTVRQNGKKEFWTLNLETLEYEAPSEKPRFESIGKAKDVEDLGERMKILMAGEDKAADLIRATSYFGLAYASQCVPETTDLPSSIDDAVRWGFSYKTGPFESWDQLGVAETTKTMKANGYEPAEWVDEMLEAGNETFYEYKNGNKTKVYNPAKKTYEPIKRTAGLVHLKKEKEAGKIISENAGASLIDLGDGIACVEFHTKMNALDEDIAQIVDEALDRAETEFDGLVIGNEAENFSAGANIFLVVMAAQNEQWDQIDAGIKGLQNRNMRMRYFPKPVVVAPAGLTLGGGAEITVHAPKVVAASELYTGFVEVGVGLVPAGGGVKEMLRRVLNPAMRTKNADNLPFLLRLFEDIGQAKVATSAEEARQMGILSTSDRVVLNREHLLTEAKREALHMIADGYTPALPEKIYAAGRDALSALNVGLYNYKESAFISEHDTLVGRFLSKVLTGGNLSSPTWVDEQYILDLEREAFLSLCGEKKTQERMWHTLQTGKPLRN